MLRNPDKQGIKRLHLFDATFLAEEKGFEPLHQFPGLRDFESRLFDQLEYSSVLTALLYQSIRKKSRVLAHCRFLFRQLDHCFRLLLDRSIILTAMGAQASRTILYAVFCICKASATLFSQHIEWAIAKQAAEALRICTAMAGEIFTFLILKKIVISHYILPFHLL